MAALELYVLRHGRAVEPGTLEYPEDRDRPLTADGARRVRKIAEGMAKMKLQFDLILSSPYARAFKTAEIAAETFQQRERVRLCDELKCESPLEMLVQTLGIAFLEHSRILAVGHEPNLSQLISLLVSGSVHCQIPLKKGGLCKMTCETLIFGQCALLDFLLTPKQLMQIAESGS